MDDTRLIISAQAPIPIASVRMLVTVNSGARRSRRSACCSTWLTISSARAGRGGDADHDAPTILGFSGERERERSDRAFLRYQPPTGPAAMELRGEEQRLLRQGKVTAADGPRRETAPDGA